MFRWTFKDSLVVGTLLGIVAMMSFLVYQSLMTRLMLNARAEIQVMTARATAEGRKFTEAERRRFNDLCRRAEYDKIPGGCDPLR